MNRSILNKLKRAIRSNLEDKAGQIIESHGSYLSKRDIKRLIKYMHKIKSYSYGVIRYIYYTSPYRYEFDPFEDNSMLCYTYDYSDIANLLWDDDRVVIPRKNRSDNDTEYAARYVFELAHIRTMQVMLLKPKIRTRRMLNHALSRAAEKGFVQIVEQLFDRHFEQLTSDNLAYAFRTACERGFHNIASILLNSVPPSVFVSAFRDASANGQLDVVRLLLADQRTDPGDLRNSAIFDACTNEKNKIDRPAVVKLLLEDERVNPRKCWLNPIERTRSYEIMKLLIDDGRYDPSSCIVAIHNLIIFTKNVVYPLPEAESIKIIQLLLKCRSYNQGEMYDMIRRSKQFECPNITAMLMAAKTSMLIDVEQKNVET